MKIPWYEYKFSGGFQWVVVAVDGDVRRDVRVFYRSNALDKRIPDSCCTGRNRRRTSRDVRHLIRLIEIGFVVVPGEAPTPLRERGLFDGVRAFLGRSIRPVVHRPLGKRRRVAIATISQFRLGSRVRYCGQRGHKPSRFQTEPGRAACQS